MSGRTSEPECWCEHVDIGVGMQRVDENPECPRHTEGMPPPGGRTYAEMAALVAAATEFKFVPDVECLDGTDRAKYAVRISKDEQGRWYLTRGVPSLYGAPNGAYNFWDCTKQRFASSITTSLVDRIFYGFDDLSLIIDLQLPAALAAQVQLATAQAAPRH